MTFRLWLEWYDLGFPSWGLHWHLGPLFPSSLSIHPCSRRPCPLSQFRFPYSCLALLTRSLPYPNVFCVVIRLESGFCLCRVFSPFSLLWIPVKDSSALFVSPCLVLPSAISVRFYLYLFFLVTSLLLFSLQIGIGIPLCLLVCLFSRPCVFLLGLRRVVSSR